MKKKLVAVLAVGFMMLVMTGAASATLLVDRGLPTTNLNNAAGANRSNVSWAFGSDESGRWLAGDDFRIGSSGNFFVDKITLWATTADSQLTLWLGNAGGTFTQYTSSRSFDVTYANGQTYQGSSGNYRGLKSYEFDLNAVLSGTATYQFFLDGSAGLSFLHSSNATLGGSPAQGADGYMLYANVSSGGLVDIGSWTSLGNGWDKASDGNIQVYGSQVPEPSTLLLLGGGLAGLVGWRRRRK